VNGRFEALRRIWEGFTENEKRLVRVLGVVTVLLIVLVPVNVLSNAIGELDAYNEQIAGVLGEIHHARERLAQRRAEREAAEARYAQRAPELGTFLEARASQRQITIASVTNQPEVQEGRFRKRHVRARLAGVSLRQAVRLLTDIESSPYPVALERIHIEHFQEGDHYNVEVGVITYDRQGASGGADAGTGTGGGGTSGGVVVRPPAGRIGPPAPAP
jgi:hypothetical protein